MLRWMIYLWVLALTGCTATKKDQTDDGGLQNTADAYVAPHGSAIDNGPRGRDDSEGGAPFDPPIMGKSAKRGIAYNLMDPADFEALSPGVRWWYNWSPTPEDGTPADVRERLGMDFVPMMWNGNYNSEDIESILRNAPHIKYLLVLNEPNFYDQANMSPRQAAELWPKYEAIAQNTGVKIVGPAMNWGTIPDYGDPIIWLDEFFEEYAALNDGAEPQVDYLAFHWYDYGLEAQLDRLADAYGKPFWVTEFANWHGLWNGPDGAEIDTVDKQIQQMTEMVEVCERRDDVFRYAWFTGRWDNDSRHTSLLSGSGELTPLSRHYISLPFSQPSP